VSEKWCQSETCIVIKESQGNIAKHLRNDELLHYTFINQSAGERIFLNGKVTGKTVTVSSAPFALHFCLQRC